jgi:FkbM family methyltransferase
MSARSEGIMLPMVVLKLANDARDILSRKYTQFEAHNIISYDKYKILSMDRDAGYARVNGWKVHYLDHATFKCVLEEVLYSHCYELGLKTHQPFIVDCGSNIGISVLFFMSMYPHGHMLAFEPDPKTFACLVQNIKENNLEDTVTPYSVALSDVDGNKKARLHIKGDEPGAGSQNLFSPHCTKSDTTIEVNVERLSTYLNEPVDLLKLDIEGAELEVLRDLVKTGKISLVRNIVMELHFLVRDHDQENCEEVLHMLTMSGFKYKIITLNNPPFDAENPLYASTLLVYARR